MDKSTSPLSLPEASFQSWVFNEIMDRMGTNIYVTDIETDQILFMNKTMKRAFGQENPIGKICWQVLQKGMDHRCDFCPVRFLKGGSLEKSAYVWEENNTLTGRSYENYDSLMRWTDGRIVHFQHSVDVTEKKRLSVAASMDELTGVYNRRAGKQKLQEALTDCKNGGPSLVLCMYDVNNLKLINDTYGHSAGDALLVSVAKEVGKELENRDFLFRLSGDEFLAMFFDNGQVSADERMKNALRRLRDEKDENLAPEEKFCFGVLPVESGTILSASQALIAVDEKLYEQKRMVHIYRAEKKLEGERGQENAEAFDYDKERLYDALVQSTDDYIYVCNMKTGVFRYPPSHGGRI